MDCRDTLAFLRSFTIWDYRYEKVIGFLRDSSIDMYAKCGGIVEARVFKRIPSKGTLSWSVILEGY
jgi:hypothetical protein